MRGVRGDRRRAARRVAASGVDRTGNDALTEALEAVDPRGELTAIGHRVVHGGPHHDRPTIIDAALLSDLRAATLLAPTHQRAALDAIDVLAGRHPQLPQVACFDTGFHRTMPETAWRLALPRQLAEQGIRRYGFHGLSYEYLVATLGAEALGRAVLAHLGSGASLAAVRDGRSVHTTMGLTPAGGIVMSHRSGDLDPGTLVYLSRALGYDTGRLEQLVNEDSGLLGISGTTGDLRSLLVQRDGGDRHAALAIDIYCTTIRMQIGAYAALLGGLDTLVFTGGVGAHSAAIRAEVCTGLDQLGIVIEPDRNAAHDPIVSVPARRPPSGCSRPTRTS